MSVPSPMTVTQEKAAARRVTAVVGVLSLAVFMSSLDLFIVNLAFPYIARQYPGTSLSSLSWVLNAYTIVFAAVLVPAGRWADRIGRRRMFVAGLALFSAGSVLCGLAPGVAALIAARVIQAVGAGAMVPASLSLLLAAVPPAARPKALGTWSALGALGAALGPVIGGSLVQVNWRWVFWINVPVGLAAVVLAVRTVPESRDPSASGRPDVLGAGFLAAAVGLVAFALVEAPSWGWGSAGFLGLLAAAVACGAAMVLRSRRHHSPVLELELLRSRTFSGAFAASILYYAGFGAFVLSAVEFLTEVWHYSAVEAGLAIAPGPLMVLPFARLVAPRLAARLGGPGRVAVIGCLVNAGRAAGVAVADPGGTRVRDPPAARPAAGRRRGRADHPLAAGRGQRVADAGQVRHRQRHPEHGTAGRHGARGGRAGGHLVAGVGGRSGHGVPARNGAGHRVLRGGGGGQRGHADGPARSRRALSARRRRALSARAAGVEREAAGVEQEVPARAPMAVRDPGRVRS